MYDIIHDIALIWSKKNKDVRPYNKFNEYILSRGYHHDFYNHIHIFYDKYKKGKYIIKINGKHIEEEYFSNKYSEKKWSELLYKKLIKGIKKVYKSNICKYKNKTHKNKTHKNKTHKNKL